jgi:hypothetical protein
VKLTTGKRKRAAVQAIADAEARFILMTTQDAVDALMIFPKVSYLYIVQYL